MSQGREQLLELVPHAGGMCLLDRVIAHSEQEIHCGSRSHRDAENPLRSGGRLSSLHLAEYGAQAVAAHGALRAGRPQAGMLAALRDIQLHVQHLEDLDCELDVHARRLLSQRDGSLYEFRVLGAGRLLCAGRIAITFAVA